MTQEIYQYGIIFVIALIFGLTIASCWVDWEKARREEDE